MKKCNKGDGIFRTRSHLVKFPTCKKELKKSLELGVMVHAFNPSTLKGEVETYLSLRPTWSTKQVQGNNTKQKTRKDVIEQAGYVLAHTSIRT